ASLHQAFQELLSLQAVLSSHCHAIRHAAYWQDLRLLRCLEAWAQLAHGRKSGELGEANEDEVHALTVEGASQAGSGASSPSSPSTPTKTLMDLGRNRSKASSPQRSPSPQSPRSPSKTLSDFTHLGKKAPTPKRRVKPPEERRRQNRLVLSQMAAKKMEEDQRLLQSSALWRWKLAILRLRCLDAYGGIRRHGQRVADCHNVASAFQRWRQLLRRSSRIRGLPGLVVVDGVRPQRRSRRLLPAPLASGPWLLLLRRATFGAWAQGSRP
ncbi:unnamed protein product, partial [Symbiodinium sp. CCMP2456]